MTSVPARPGAAERHDHARTRDGVASLFLSCEPFAGWRHVAATDHHRRVDRARFVRDLVDGHRHDAARLVLAMDQLNTHSLAGFHEAFPPVEAKRLTVRSVTCTGSPPRTRLRARRPSPDTTALTSQKLITGACDVAM